MANTKNEAAVGAKLYHFGYGALTIEKVEELNGKTYLHAKVDDVSGVPYRFRKHFENRAPLVVFDNRTVGHWVFLNKEDVLHEDFGFVLEGSNIGCLNHYTVDLIHKQLQDVYSKSSAYTIENGYIVDADGVIIGKSK